MVLDEGRVEGNWGYPLGSAFMTGLDNPRLNRRRFLSAACAVAAASSVPAQVAHFETLVQWLRASRKSRELELRKCLDRIRETEPSIHAWVQVKPLKPTGNGKLSGIPFGVKDIVETKGLATEYGSPIYKGRVGMADAAIIRDMRQRGAILLGKTQTAAFAYRTPAPTRNPHDLGHTPGGSSSGSAAAVAAGMVPVAVGEQTLGSVLRPASYCGVTGFKPTYGLLSMQGVLPLAKSLDTLGFFTPTATDMLALWEALGHPAGREEDISMAAPDPLPDVEPPMKAAFQDAVSTLQKAGVFIRFIDISGMLSQLFDAANTVMFYEGARFHEERFREYGSRLADLADLVQKGLQIPAGQYDEAKRQIAENMARMAEFYRTTPVILTPAATGPAPVGLAYTGDARMNAPWTALGTPAVTIPIPISNGLPLGLQITGDRGQDATVLRTAVRLQGILIRKPGAVG